MLAPLQLVVTPEIEVGATDGVATVMLTVVPGVCVLQGAGSILLTQYTVEVVGATVIVAAVCPEMVFEPTVQPVPHWYEPALAKVPPVAVKVMLVPLQMDDAVVLIEVGFVEAAETVMVCVTPAV